ncbi:hypothetical protein [Streptomyces sp. SGAir0957]
MTAGYVASRTCLGMEYAALEFWRTVRTRAESNEFSSGEAKQ